MDQNILITGAAGYTGGTVLAKLLQSPSRALRSARLWAAVRTAEQAKAMSEWDVRVLQLDLRDSDDVAKAVVDNKIHMVVHTASVELSQATNMIKALGRVREASGKDVYFFNPGIMSMFSAEGGWPYGQVRDTDPLFDLEKIIGRKVPVRAVSIAVIEMGQEHGVKTLNVPLPAVYGRGLGLVKKLSLAAYPVPPTTHVEDLADLYVLLIEKISRAESIPTGEEGCFFPIAHKWPWWPVLQAIAGSLHSRGLIPDPTVRVWPDWDVAARTLGLPRVYIETMLMSSGDFVPGNAFRLGWQPKWDEERFLKNIDDQVQDALDLDKFKATAYDAFMKDA